MPVSCVTTKYLRKNGYWMEHLYNMDLPLNSKMQIHPFCEGNTRTTAVFVIKYLRSLGFDVNNTTFEKNSWYFRNALVRANYQNLQKGIYKETIHLERFFRNLLMGEENVLMNRHLHIKAKELLDGHPSKYPNKHPDKCHPRERKC